ncbi:MAG: hypothetical protein JXR71_10650 [Bacteroidales bacterium]|nr:hypothetical protein [Bacteroidales bacterium]
MKNWIIWILAIFLTLGAAYYQRKTGPTYPMHVKTELSGQKISFTLPRSHTNETDCPVDVTILNPTISGKIVYRIFPVAKKWDTVPMQREGNLLTASLPAQPAAGKLAYRIILSENNQNISLPVKEPVVIRFKGSVPAFILIPHIIFMFFAMLLSMVAGLMALWKKPHFRIYASITLLLLIIGGGILGPIVQKYAFGDLWTGIPFGWDLTDNKTLIALIFWIAAVLFNMKKKRYAWVVIAAVVLLLVYSIPHSMFGSEYNYETGKVVQGLIVPFFWMGIRRDRKMNSGKQY